MELTLIYTIIGFALAGWSVIANDSIQTLGTFIASKQKWFKWYILASAASVAMIATISYGKERPVNSGSGPLAWSQNRRSVTVKAN